jgi:hypothetical protein
MVGNRMKSPSHAADFRDDEPQTNMARTVRTFEKVVCPRSPKSEMLCLASAPPNIMELPKAVMKLAASTGVIPMSLVWYVCVRVCMSTTDVNEMAHEANGLGVKHNGKEDREKRERRECPHREGIRDILPFGHALQHCDSNEGLEPTASVKKSCAGEWVGKCQRFLAPLLFR